jgi:6-phosphogluconolactonase (cycloisomerase 2 family)
LFTLHELDNSLTVQAISQSPNGVSVTLATANVVPTDNDVPAGAKFAAAEILIPPTSQQFPTPFIYTSNRNIGTPDPRGDSIAIFQFLARLGQRPELKLINHVFTGLQKIRGMAFNEEGLFLVAGASDRGGIKVFRRVDGGKNLKEVASNAELGERTTFVWPITPYV